jgi:hypothetical protein
MSAQVGRGDCYHEGSQGSVSLATVGPTLSNCAIVVIRIRYLKMILIFNKHHACAGCEATTARSNEHVLRIVVGGMTLMR